MSKRRQARHREQDPITTPSLAAEPQPEQKRPRHGPIGRHDKSARRRRRARSSARTTNHPAPGTSTAAQPSGIVASSELAQVQPPALMPWQRELMDRGMHIDVATAVAREVMMAFLWESAGVHPAELEHMAYAALENAVRLFDTTWGLPFAAFARPHVYVALMAIARQRRVAHSLSLWLFKAAAPWPAWRDTKVAAYHRKTELLEAIWTAIEALPPDLRTVIDQHHLPRGLPDWFPADAPAWLGPAERKHALALSYIRERLQEAGLVTPQGAVAA